MLEKVRDIPRGRVGPAEEEEGVARDELEKVESSTAAGPAGGGMIGVRARKRTVERIELNIVMEMGSKCLRETR